MTCDHILCRGVDCENDFCLCRCHSYDQAMILNPRPNTSDTGDDWKSVFPLATAMLFGYIIIGLAGWLIWRAWSGQ